MPSLQFKRASRPNEIWVCCPFCVERGQPTPDDKYKLGVNLRSGAAHCFRCGWKSRGQGTFRKLKLGEMSLLDEEPKEEKKTGKIHLPEEYESLKPEDQDEFTITAWNYLQERNVTEGQVRKKRIGFCASGPYAYRIIFPIWDTEKKLVGWVGRDWTGKQELKYKNAPGMKRVWYGGWRLKKLSNLAPLVLCEGIFDVLAIERTGYFCPLASLGRVVTEEQEKALDRFKLICILMDNDRDGLTSGLDTGRKLRRADRALFWAVPPKGFHDAGEMNNKSLTSCLNIAQPFNASAELKIQMMAGQL